LVETFTPRAEIERSARYFFALVMLLSVIGLVMVYSTTAVKSARSGREETELLFTQLLKMAVALAAMLVMMKIDYRVLARHHIKILLLIMVVLVLVLLPIPGLCGAVNGACRWFRIGGFMIQPSEFAKLGLMVILASMVVKSGDDIQSFFKGFLPPVLVTLLVCLPILIEPDFGTCVLTGGIAVLLLVIGGARIVHFIAIVGVCAPLLFLFAFNNMGHVKERIVSFLNPQGTGQVAEGLTALGSGGLIGKGLGGGISKLYYVPLCESDFIFSIIGEELGFVGTSGLILIFVLLIYHGMKVLLGVKNRFGFILALGILLLIATQALANIAVVLGLAPAKGVALPFVSSGGSSMMALMMGVGIFMRIARHPDLPAPRFKEEFVPSLFRHAVVRMTRSSRDRFDSMRRHQ
jgi:cell division protein FtsW